MAGDADKTSSKAQEKRPSRIHMFMLVQRLDARCWPLVEGHEDDIEWILDRVVTILEEHGHRVGIAYGIDHDHDVHHILDHLDKDPLFYIARPGTPKPPHVHFAVHFVRGDRGATARQIAGWVGVDVQYIEIGKSGRYSWDDFCAYLIHRKASWKFQYSPDDVVTVRGPEYADLEREHGLLWYNGRKTVEDVNASQFAPLLRELARDGKIGHEDLLADDELYGVYTRLADRVRDQIDRLIGLASERRVLKQARALERGDVHTGTVFIHGRQSGSGKTMAATRIAELLGKTYGWRCFHATPRHALEGYAGEEIILLDEMDAKGWTLAGLLQLLDPASVSQADARYAKTGPIAPNLVLVTSMATLSDLVWFMPGREQHGHAMDEVLRRVALVVESTGYVWDTDRAEYARHGYDVYHVVPCAGGRSREWPLPETLPDIQGRREPRMTSMRTLAYEGSVDGADGLAVVLCGARELAGSMPDDGRPALELPSGTVLRTDRDAVMRERAIAHLTPVYGEAGATHLVDDHHDGMDGHGWHKHCRVCGLLRADPTFGLQASGHSDEPVARDRGE